VTLAEQTFFYSALLDEIDVYTSEAVLTERTLQNLGPDEQRQIQSEQREKARQLQKDLVWAEENLDLKAISQGELERSWPHQVTPRPTPIRRQSLEREPDRPHDNPGDGGAPWPWRTRVDLIPSAAPTRSRPTRSQGPTGQALRQGVLPR